MISQGIGGEGETKRFMVALNAESGIRFIEERARAETKRSGKDRGKFGGKMITVLDSSEVLYVGWDVRTR